MKPIYWATLKSHPYFLIEKFQSIKVLIKQRTSEQEITKMSSLSFKLKHRNSTKKNCHPQFSFLREIW
jgi:hypothetical protein